MKKLLRNRADMAQLLLELIRPLKPFYSEGHARLKLGNTGAHYGENSAQMEGFARILWGLGPLWSGDNRSLPQEQQREIDEWHEFYLQGIIHGTDPAHEEYWGEIKDFDQKMVEIAALVTAISLSPEKMWKPLTEAQQENLYRWINQINHKKVHANNWRFFRILTNMAFRLLGLAWNRERLKEDLDIIEGCYAGDGWYYDGHPGQVDYYIPFAMHYYSLLYAAFMEKEDSQYAECLKERSRRFCEDFIYWFSPEGEEIPYGRSLTYRFAHAAYFSAMAFAGVEGIGYGKMRHLLLGNLQKWMEKPIFDNAGVLSIGYWYPNLFMSERYNAPGSPYWSLKAFLVLALPDSHPFWQAEEECVEFVEKKSLSYPHMLITHDENGHVLAYPTGQHSPDFGNTAAKYEKFVYSSQFGFSVPRGNAPESGAFDNTLAVSRKGENHYQMRSGADSFSLTEQYVSAGYHILPDVYVESVIVPLMQWHVRIHKITAGEAVDVLEGGFSIPMEHGRERYTDDMIQTEGGRICAMLPWGISAVSSKTGGEAKLIVPFPNTNLFYNLTLLPGVAKTLEPGKHLLISCIFADQSPRAAEYLKKEPEVIVTDEGITVEYEGETICTVRC